MAKLTFYDRTRIEYYLNIKEYSIRKTSKLINRHHSVIVREIKRNISKHLKHYDALLAQTEADRKSRITNKRKLDKYPQLKKYIIEKLDLDWSPEQISGRLKKHPPPRLNDYYVCPETIYDYIYTIDQYLYHKLRQKHYIRMKLKGKKTQIKKINIPDRVSIHTRSKQINKRTKLGDWETDLMEFSKQKDNLSVDIERLSRLVRIHKLKSKQADEKLDALNQTFRDLPDNLKQTLTFDNGTENVKHKKLIKEHDIKTYFCDPYSSWQKGSVENMNGLIRQYFPRKTNLQKTPHRIIYEVQERLNNRPRKCLNYLTPNEIINKQVVH